MTRRYTHLDEQKLADILKREASRHTPPHSETLHTRIIQQITPPADASTPPVGSASADRLLPSSPFVPSCLRAFVPSPSPGTPGEGRGEGSEPVAHPIENAVSRPVRSVATTRISLTPWRWLPLAAAAILLAFCLWSSQSKSPAPRTPAPRTIAHDTLPTIPPVDEICQRLASNAYDRLETQLKERQLAYLDDDARRLAHFVLDCTTPLPPQKR